MTGKHKTYLVWLALSFAAGIAAIVALNWLVDPLQFYRRATYPPLLIGEKRFQIPGIAKNYDYDSLVLGTSVSENIASDELHERFGWHTLNLAMQGASAREQHLALEVALRTGKVKNVLWDLNWEYLRGSPEWVANYDGSFPFYFYDENPANELNNYLLSIDTLKNSVKVLLRRWGLPTYQPRTTDEAFVWINKKKFGPDNVRKAWAKATARRFEHFTSQTAEYAVANLNANFEKNVLSEINAHPEVNFVLYFPPLSLGYYNNLNAADPQIFTNLIANKCYIIEKLGGLTAYRTNARLFDFQAEADIVCNPTNYCDLVHYDLKISRQLLDAIHDDRYRATRSSPDQLQRLVESPRMTEWMEKVLPKN